MALETTPTNAIKIEALDSITLAGAEISAYDAATKRIFVTSSSGLQIVDATDPRALTLVTTIAPAALGFGSSDVTSVAAKNGIIAVALPNSDKTLPGQVLFLDANGNLLGSVQVGSLPDMVTFTADGTKVLVANEGEVATNGTDPAPGSVSIIDISGGFPAVVSTASFAAFDGQEAALRDAGVRIFPGKTVSQDVEPEYIAISPDGTKAFVTLQEANAIAILDIATATFTEIVPLGTKDFSSLQADFTDRDGPGDATAILLKTGQPVFGMYMPDAIASFEANGQAYYVIANEGDDRDDFLAPDETIRVSSGSYDLDDTVFTNETALKDADLIGRLTVSNVGAGSTDPNITQLRGDIDGDGDIDQILTYGARSFSILDAQGNIVFDSADIIERVTAAIPGAFDDTRSDNKAAEPEGVTVGTIGDRTFAFVVLERSNAIMTFDITNPADVTFTQFTSNVGDISPEGVLFVGADQSPNGADLLIVSNEVSGTLSVFSAEERFQLQLLHFSDGEAGLLASSTAPYLAALVDAFEEDYANTIILSGGDNFLPGPFLNAGTDPSVTSVHGLGANLGAADIAMHNIIGVQASTIGNHEFDLGTREFRDAVLDAQFPYLSANLNFSGDADLAPLYTETVGVNGLEEASALRGRLVPSSVITKNGEKIGLVGATTQILESISSTGGVEVKGFAGDGAETNDMALLAAQLQPVIDDLRAQGVNKIILMSHLQQIEFERALAPLLQGVDIILSAGSNTRLGDDNDQAVDFPGHGANFEDQYPIVTAGADGKTTLIVNTDNEYTYLGRLVVDFDANGDIILDSLDTAVNGAYASTSANVAAAWGVAEADLATTAFAEGTKGERVGDITEAVQSVINDKDGTIYGYTEVYLEGERAIVRNEETNLGNLTADANKFVTEQALGSGIHYVVALKNGGGIRAQIGSVIPETGEKIPPIANPVAGKPEGGVSQLDVENSLRFNNILMVFDTTAQGLKNILEHGVALYGNQGRFPQIGGVRFSYDTDLPAGSRIQDIALIDDNDNVILRVYDDGVLEANPSTVISVSTLNFLAGNADAPIGNEPGGDGYPIRANGTNFRYLKADGSLSGPVDPKSNFTSATVIANAVGSVGALGEQTALQEYMQEFHATEATSYDEADTAISGDTRIQNLNFRDDTVLDGDSIFGDNRNNVLIGTAANELIDGGKGNDTIKGGAGDDTLIGGEGNDTVSGQDGDDTFIIGSGGDSALLSQAKGGESFFGNAAWFHSFRHAGYYGHNWWDILNPHNDKSDDGRDTYDGGSGSDTLDFSPSKTGVRLDLSDGTTKYGNDTIKSIENLIGTAKADELGGNSQANTLYGRGGDDVLSGEGGKDTLYGGAGRDMLFGGDDNDVLDGGAGDDKLVGGRGYDNLTGGEGRDRFYFSSIVEIGKGANRDVITDFAARAVAGSNNDLIDLSEIDANSGKWGDQSFKYIGTNAFSRDVGQVRYLHDGGRTIVEGDVNGDRIADFQLELTGVLELRAADFVL